MNFSSLWRGILLILTLCVIGYAVHRLHLEQVLDAHWMDNWVRGKGLAGVAALFLAGSLLTAVGVPRQVIAFFCGYSFGLVVGVVVSVLTSAAGALLVFGYARLMARRLVTDHFPRQVARLDRFTNDSPFVKILAVRLLPVGNNMVTSLVAGVSGISMTAFAAGSAVGFIPQSVVFALAGSGVAVDPALRIGTSVVLFLVFGIIAIGWYRRLQRGAGGDPLNGRLSTSRTQTP